MDPINQHGDGKDSDQKGPLSNQSDLSLFVTQNHIVNFLMSRPNYGYIDNQFRTSLPNFIKDYIVVEDIIKRQYSIN